MRREARALALPPSTHAGRRCAAAAAATPTTQRRALHCPGRALWLCVVAAALCAVAAGAAAVDAARPAGPQQLQAPPPPQPSPPAPRVLVVIRTHEPTEAQKLRACHLDAEAAAAPAGAAANVSWAVLFSPTRRDTPTPAYPCNVTVLRVGPEDVTAAAGGDEVFERMRLQPRPRAPPFWLAPAPLAELALHALRGPQLGYDYLWVVEQDVAWQGNFFEFLATFRDTPGDFLCYRLRLVSRLGPTDAAAVAGEVGRDGAAAVAADLGNLNLSVSKPDFWWSRESGWTNGTPAARAHAKCLIVTMRYSARLLDELVGSYLAHGQWAYEEWWMATACLKLLGGWDPPCSVRDLGGPAAPPGQKALFHPQRYAIAGCCARGPARPKAWAGGRLRPWAYDMGAPTQLWHPMKF